MSQRLQTAVGVRDPLFSSLLKPAVTPLLPQDCRPLGALQRPMGETPGGSPALLFFRHDGGSQERGNNHSRHEDRRDRRDRDREGRGRDLRMDDRARDRRGSRESGGVVAGHRGEWEKTPSRENGGGSSSSKVRTTSDRSARSGSHEGGTPVVWDSSSTPLRQV